MGLFDFLKSDNTDKLVETAEISENTEHDEYDRRALESVTGKAVQTNRHRFSTFDQKAKQETVKGTSVVKSDAWEFIKPIHQKSGHRPLTDQEVAEKVMKGPHQDYFRHLEKEDYDNPLYDVKGKVNAAHRYAIKQGGLMRINKSGTNYNFLDDDKSLFCRMRNDIIKFASMRRISGISADDVLEGITDELQDEFDSFNDNDFSIADAVSLILNDKETFSSFTHIDRRVTCYKAVNPVRVVTDVPSEEIAEEIMNLLERGKQDTQVIKNHLFHNTNMLHTCDGDKSRNDRVNHVLNRFRKGNKKGVPEYFEKVGNNGRAAVYALYDPSSDDNAGEATESALEGFVAEPEGEDTPDTKTAPTSIVTDQKGTSINPDQLLSIEELHGKITGLELTIAAKDKEIATLKAVVNKLVGNA